MTDTKEEFQTVLDSQKLEKVNIPGDEHHHKYLSTVMSLVCRWPPFDFMLHNKYHYQKIKSDQIMKVAHIDKAGGTKR